MTCLAKKPEERFASMDELIAAHRSGRPARQRRATSDRAAPRSRRADRRAREASDRRWPTSSSLPSCAEMRVAIDGVVRRRRPAGGSRGVYIVYAGAVGAGSCSASIGVVALAPCARDTPGRAAADARPAPTARPTAPRGDSGPSARLAVIRPRHLVASAIPSRRALPPGERAPDADRERRTPQPQRSFDARPAPRRDLDDVGRPLRQASTA